MISLIGSGVKESLASSINRCRSSDRSWRLFPRRSVAVPFYLGGDLGTRRLVTVDSWEVASQLCGEYHVRRIANPPELFENTRMAVIKSCHRKTPWRGTE
jgi:hypothetical protein